MQKINLSLAKPGMKLGRTLVNKQNMVVCAKGTELTAGIIDRLEQMQINQLTVEGHPVEGLEEKTVEQLKEEINKRFRKVANDPVMQEIKNIFLRRCNE